MIDTMSVEERIDIATGKGGRKRDWIPKDPKGNHDDASGKVRSRLERKSKVSFDQSHYSLKVQGGKRVREKALNVRVSL